MLRSFKLHCALGTLALACGGATDDNLFGDAANVQTGGSSAGPKATPSGGTSPGPTGGSATTTGGRASGTGGTGTSQGGDTEAGSGGAGAGLSGMGGSPHEGGAEPGGGTSTGGTKNPSGGAPSASGGSGNATGGTVSASGGVVSGGSGGASGGNPSGKGGTGGMVSCQQAREAVNAALEAAQACENDKDDQCLGFVDGECCPVPVNDPSSTEAQQYQAALTKMNKVCGPSLCPAVLCTEPKQAVCESKSSGVGRCEAKSILSL
jgi:hypothetical protein